MTRYKNEAHTALTARQKKKAEQKYDMWYNKEDSYSIQLESIDGLE